MPLRAFFSGLRLRAAALALTIAALAAVLPAPAFALELLVFDADWCAPCRKFKKEVMPEWRESELGSRIPLKLVEMKDQAKLGVEFAEKVAEVPVFVLVDKGVEVGRVVGYANPRKFWAELKEALESRGDGAGD